MTDGVSIKISANAQQYYQEMQRVAQTAESMSQRVGMSFKSLSLGAAGLAGVGSLAALKTNVEAAIGSMAGLKDASERTGAAVEKLSGLKGVAKIGGHDFELIEGSIIKLNKALHATDDESKGAGKALAAIGLNIAELRDQDPADAMMEIAKAFQNVEEGSGKSAAAVAIFGRTGAQMLPYLNDLAEKGDLVGKVTREQAEMADQYEKNMAKLSVSLGNVSKTLAAELLPTMTRFSEELLEGIKHAGGFWSALAAGATINPFKGTADNLKSVRADLEEMERVAREEGYMDEARFNRKKAQYEMLKAAQRREALAGSPDGNMDANDRKFARKINLDNQTFGPGEKERVAAAAKKRDAEAIIKSLDEQIALKQLDLETDGKLSEGQRVLAKTLADIEAGHIKVSAAERQSIEAKAAKLTAIEREVGMQQLVDKVRNEEEQRLVRHLNSLDEEAAKLERQAEVYGLTEAQISVIAQARTADALAMAQQVEGNEAQVAVLERELAARQRISDALVVIDRKKQDMDELKDSTKAGADAARELGMTFSSAFEDAVIGGKKASEVMRGLAQDIARIMLRKTVTEPMAGAFSNLFKDLFDGFSLTANANGAVYSSPALSSYSGSIVDSPTIFPFARGAGLMGEAGPEGIFPLKRGRDGKLGVSAEGASPTININITNEGAADGYQAQATARNNGTGTIDIDVIVRRAILGDIGRNGPITKSLAGTFGLGRAI